MELGSGLVSSAQTWFDRFEGEEVGQLYAPWSLHTGLAPDAAGGGFQTLAIAATLHGFGLPVVKGGSANFVKAFERLIADNGGTVRTGVDVERDPRPRRPRGRRRRRRRGDHRPPRGDRERHPDPALRPPARPGRRARRSGRRGQGLPLRAPQRDADPHRALGAPEVARLAPRRHRRSSTSPTVPPTSPSPARRPPPGSCRPRRPWSIGQPARVDPSRVPEGKGMIWIQLQEVPRAPRGDAAGEIDIGDGTWTEELTDAYVERVLGEARAAGREPRRGARQGRRAEPDRDRAPQPEPRRRRHLRRRLRARPDLLLAPAARLRLARDPGRRPPHVRRRDLPRPGPERRLRADRRQRAAEGERREADRLAPRPMSDADRLDGRAAIVTGAGRGLGEAIAIELAARGARVLLADIDGDAAEARRRGDPRLRRRRRSRRPRRRRLGRRPPDRRRLHRPRRAPRHPRQQRRADPSPAPSGRSTRPSGTT